MKKKLIDHTRNCFDAVRLLAACAVIFDHGHALTGSSFRPSILSNSLGGIAVKIFFVVSGYLVFTSWERDNNFVRYIMRRSLRIFPALIVLTLLTMLVVGPLLSTMTIASYYGDKDIFLYLKNIVLYPVYALPGVFTNNTYPGAVNGSLWTLPVEFSLYLVLPAFMLVARMFRTRLAPVFVTTVVCVGALWYVYLFPLRHVPILYGTLTTAAAGIAPYFFIGATFKIMHWDETLDATIAIFGIAIGAVIQTRNPVINEIILYVILPYSTLAVAKSSQKRLSSVGRYGDFSYGIYIYAFLVQQTLNHIFNNSLTSTENIFLTIPITFLVAALSWYLVEKPCLRFKPKALNAVV